MISLGDRYSHILIRKSTQPLEWTVINESKGLAFQLTFEKLRFTERPLRRMIIKHFIIYLYLVVRRGAATLRTFVSMSQHILLL